MQKILYSGNQLNDTHLKRINCILQNQANATWASVRTYDLLYKKGYREYLVGSEAGNKAFSDSNEAYDYISTYKAIEAELAGQLEGTQEAQQAATEASNDVTKVLEEQPKIDTAEAFKLSQETQEAAKEAEQAWEKADADATVALEDAQNAENATNAANVASGTSAGVGSYYNPETGQTQTVTNDGNGTTSISNVTASDGTVGTVTHHPDGTTTFTPNDGGGSMPWTDPNGVEELAQNGAAAAQAKSDESAAQSDASKAAAEQAETEYAEKRNEMQEKYGIEVHSDALEMRENSPSGDSDGVKVNDDGSSTYTSDEYDPSEWGGF